MSKIVIAATFAVVLGGSVAGLATIAEAAGDCANALTGAPVSCAPHSQGGVHGTVHPRSHLALLPPYLLPENRDPLLYNLPHEFNPLDFPYNDNIRQDYPGLGLYR